MGLLVEQLHKRLRVCSTSYQRQPKPCGHRVYFLPKLEARRHCSTKAVIAALGRPAYTSLAYRWV